MPSWRPVFNVCQWQLKDAVFCFEYGIPPEFVPVMVQFKLFGDVLKTLILMLGMKLRMCFGRSCINISFFQPLKNS